MPIDGATGLSRCRSFQVSTPGLRWGSSPVSSSTRIAIARTYDSVSSYPWASSHSRAWCQRSSGRSPSVNSASLQPIAAPWRAMSSTSSGDRKAAGSLWGAVANVQ